MQQNVGKSADNTCGHLTGVAPRIGQLIRLLGSSQDGEALGACRALGRVLDSAGADFHELADCIEAQAAPSVRRENRHTVDDWHAQARSLDERAESLTRTDRVFVQSLLAGSDEPTKKQKTRLRALYEAAK
jgi:hypothetical protein